MLGAAKAYCEILEDEKMSEDLKSMKSIYESKAHSSHQKSSDGDLHGTINCFKDTDGVVFRYVYKPKNR
jgi:hypothetical protein